MSSTPHNPAQARTCGQCTVCCTATAIEPLGKPCGTRCSLLADHGCSVYAERPGNPKYRDCIAFECLWLQGWHAEADRPDNLNGVMFVGKDDPNHPGTLMIHVVEARIGAASHPRVKALIQQHLSEGYLVVVQNQHYAFAYLPNGDTYRYLIDLTDPLKSRIDPRVAPVQITAGGKPLSSSKPS